MITKQEHRNAVDNAMQLLGRAGLVITPEEQQRLEVADFGLGELEQTGLQILTYVNTERVCAKELMMTPHQTCPEHRHPMVDGRPGKEETFRCRWGIVYIYVPGTPTEHPAGKPPRGSEKYYTVMCEICLRPGEQYTMTPDTLHWFQAGAEGAVVSEFSTRSIDEADIFTDPRIKRMPEISPE